MTDDAAGVLVPRCTRSSGAKPHDSVDLGRALHQTGRGPAMPPGALAGVPAAVEGAELRERLYTAEQAARAGRADLARWLCAAAILEHQPLLAGSKPLLRQAIATLLHSQAFGQLARLLGAVQGRKVRFCAQAGTAAAFAQTTHDRTNETEEYVLNPAWLTADDGDQIVLRWAEALAAGSPRTPQPLRH